MGFMAGFGPAFSEGMKKNNELREQRKDDAFKLTFAEMSKRREQYAADKKEDQALVRKAKAFASMKDPALWPKVYEWAKAGLSDEQIKENMQGTFTQEGPTAPAPAAKAGSNSANQAVGAMPQAKGGQPGVDTPVAADAVADQMGGSGLAPQTPPPFQSRGAQDPMVAGQGQTVQDPNEDVAPKGLLTNLSGKFKGGAKSSFLRNTFGNGGGAESRAEAMGEAKGAVEATFGELGVGAEEFGTYEGAAADASGIGWTPAKEAEKADPINNLKLARIALDNARASGDPKLVEVAERRYNGMVEEEENDSIRKARENGHALPPGIPFNVFIKDPKAPGGKRFGGVKYLEQTPQGFRDIGGETLDPSLVEVRPRTEQNVKDEDVLFKNVEKPFSDYSTKMNRFETLTEGVGSLDRIYEAKPEALQKYATMAATTVQDLTNEGKAVASLLSKSDESLDIPADAAVNMLSNTADALQQKLDAGGSEVEILANTAALAEIKKAMLVYELAASRGQEGRNLAETERKLFGEVFSASNYPQFRLKMNEILKGERQIINREAESLRNNLSIKRFNDQNGYVPNALRIETADERLSMAEPDSDMARGRELMKSPSVNENPADKAKKNMGVDTPKQEKYPEGATINNGLDPSDPNFRRMVRQGGVWVPVK